MGLKGLSAQENIVQVAASSKGTPSSQLVYSLMCHLHEGNKIYLEDRPLEEGLSVSGYVHVKERFGFVFALPGDI